MEKKEITEILNMPFARFLEVYGGLSLNKISGMLRLILFSEYFKDVDHMSPVKKFLYHPMCDWDRVRGFGKTTQNLLFNLLEPFGLRLGMTKAEIAAVEGEPTDSPNPSFQDYINTLKHFADNAGACAIANEFTTEDGYNITIKIEKIKK